MAWKPLRTVDWVGLPTGLELLYSADWHRSGASPGQKPGRAGLGWRAPSSTLLSRGGGRGLSLPDGKVFGV